MPLLRRAAPAAARPFRVPASPALPLLGALACLALLVALPPVTWLQLVAWVVAGAVLYLGGRGVARLRRPGATAR